MWQVQVFTLYPETFPGPLSKGLYGKALEKRKWNLKVVNIRDSAEDKHKTVDDAPFGGGAGMLLKADILAKSIDNNLKDEMRITVIATGLDNEDEHIFNNINSEIDFKEKYSSHSTYFDKNELENKNLEDKNANQNEELNFNQDLDIPTYLRKSKF